MMVISQGKPILSAMEPPIDGPASGENGPLTGLVCCFGGVHHLAEQLSGQILCGLPLCV